MEATVNIVDVDRTQTRKGNTRFTVRDAEGHEYVTFRPQIGEQAERYKGKPARIEFHEEQRGQYQNVYLDAVEPLDDAAAASSETRDQADAVAWEAAAEAAPLIVGSEAHLSGEELFEALKPFKDRVAADIRRGASDERGDADEDEPAAPSNVMPLRKPTKRAGN